MRHTRRGSDLDGSGDVSPIDQDHLVIAGGFQCVVPLKMFCTHELAAFVTVGYDLRGLGVFTIGALILFCHLC